MTYTILHVDSSPLGEQSTSRKYTARLVKDLVQKHPGSRVIVRDLAAAPLPHLDADTVHAIRRPPDQRDAAMQRAIVASDKAVDELLAADSIVIGAPMWNFGIPSSLKAWIDHVVRAGRTFSYSKNPPGLLGQNGQKLYIVSARGGLYSAGNPMQPFDHQETYLRDVFGFIGLKDISFIRAEGVGLGDESLRQANAAADQQLTELLKQTA